MSAAERLQTADWMKNQVVIPIGAYAVSADPDAALVTYALGSCVAVIAHDPVRRIGGLLHFMLPSSSISPQRAEHEPAVFADTGVPLLFEKLYQLGTTKRDLVVRLCGGANLTDASGTQIAQRNVMTVRKMFWKVGVLTAAEDVGGMLSRTVRLHVGDGRTIITSNGQERQL